MPSPKELTEPGSGSENTCQPSLIVIVGPTAVGKTKFSILLAEQTGGEIVSADSRLFYKGMDIGTCKPSTQERKRVSHHLIDVADPDDTWSLSVFQQAAKETISAIHARGHLPFLVGGTGQYIRAITQGWMPPVIPPHPDIRAELENLANVKGPKELHNHLAQLDPEAAHSIDPRNLRRVIRALEVIRLTGNKFSSLRGKSTSPYRILTLGLTRSRQELYQRIDERIDEMFVGGLLQEVENLIAAGFSPDLPAMSSIGYQECAAVIQGKMALEEAKMQMRRRTKAYVRRQSNWFKLDDPTIHWFDAGKTTVDHLMTVVRSFLSASQ